MRVNANPLRSLLLSKDQLVVCTIINGMNISNFSVNVGYSERAGFHILFPLMDAIVLESYSVSSYRSNCGKQ